VRVGRATADDADTMSRIATDTFVETFGALYPPEDLAYFLACAAAGRHAASLL